MSSRNKIVVALVSIIAVLALAFAGLTIAGTFGGGATSGANTAAKTGSTSGSTAARASGTLKLLGSDPPTLDPALSGDADSASYIVEIFSGLVSLNTKLQIEPDLAQSWDVSPDGTTYTFHLRQGAKFQDGKEVKASDFKYSFERAADPKTESTTADTYLGDIVGLKDKLAGKATEVKGVTVIDDYTLQIKIDAAKAYFLAKMTFPAAFVLDKANVDSGKNWTAKPNGTGPFKLKQWSKGDKLVLERNDNYYETPAKLQTIEYGLSGGSAMTMYENGEIDITGVGLTDIDRVMDPSNALNKELVIAPEMSIGYIGFNTTMPPFDDAKVRQAFNMAVDKDKIIKVVLKGLEDKSNGILPPGMPGYNDKLKGLDFDVAKAKQLISESKYGDVSKLPPITDYIPGSGASLPPTSEAITEMWKTNLGVNVDIKQVEWATYLQDLKNHKYQMFEIGWIADYPDPHDFLDILFRSNSLENNSQYSNPEVDKLLDAAQVERDVNKRMKMYQDAEQMIVNDAPWIPLWNAKSYVLVKPYVKGYNPPAMVVEMMKYVSIEK